MKTDDKTIQELLLKENYITPDDITRAERLAKSHRTGIIEQLLSLGIVTNDLVGQAIAESFKVPFADLDAHTPSRNQVKTIPENVAKKYNVVLFDAGAKSIVVATSNPKQSGLNQTLKKIFQSKKITIAYGLQEYIDAAFIHYRKALETRFSKIIKRKKRIAPEILEEIFNDALVYHASDIHFEPSEHDVLIRFRIDGIMQEAGRIDKEFYGGIVNRIKVQSHLRTDEHQAAQDASIRYEKNDKATDLRVSIVPVIDGEKIVIRVLSEYVRNFTLSDLGLSVRDQKIFLEAANKPYGMIIVTGPTGSGKTTTLYGLLKNLNRPEVNISTIEDPVEYKIAGVNHIQVNKQTDLTFSKGLRSIVRQDPDVILVGEIRDTETAEISVNAALTGHLLLTTFHANDAATAIPRLIDMDVEPFLLSSTLELLVAQRLVRRICNNCRVSINLSAAEVKKLSPDAAPYLNKKTNVIYQGNGCTVCNHTGYKGRIAVFELIKTTPELQDLILQKPSTQEIQKLTRAQGSRAMYEDGIEKVKAGVTTLEELTRVVPAD